MENSDSRSERIAITWKICARVSTVNTIVCQCASRAQIAHAWVKSDSAAISSPTQTMC